MSIRDIFGLNERIAYLTRRLDHIESFLASMRGPTESTKRRTNGPFAILDDGGRALKAKNAAHGTQVVTCCNVSSLGRARMCTVRNQ
eukprot:8854-Eustigmatos_ZCMA.PRE.1